MQLFVAVSHKFGRAVEAFSPRSHVSSSALQGPAPAESDEPKRMELSATRSSSDTVASKLDLCTVSTTWHFSGLPAARHAAGQPSAHRSRRQSSWTAQRGSTCGVEAHASAVALNCTYGLALKAHKVSRTARNCRAYRGCSLERMLGTSNTASGPAGPCVEALFGVTPSVWLSGKAQAFSSPCAARHERWHSKPVHLLDVLAHPRDG
jgi:hypothetical protein